MSFNPDLNRVTQKVICSKKMTNHLQICLARIILFFFVYVSIAVNTCLLAKKAIVSDYHKYIVAVLII